MNVRIFSLTLGVREAVFLAVLILGVVALLSAMSRNEPFASAEVRFVEKSSGGLNIIPASCPSDPHYSGQCSGQPPPPGMYCDVYVDPQTIVRGKSATLSWAVNTDSFGNEYAVIDPLSGQGGNGNEQQSYPPSGSEEVSPTADTTYTVYAYTNYGSTYFGSCWRTLAVCPPSQFVFDNACVASCPVGYEADAEGQCIFNACPAGYVYNQQTLLCEQGNGQCTPQNICGSDPHYNMVVNSCTGAVVDNCNTHGPDWYCSGGQCVYLPPGSNASGSITATPALVRSGETTQVEWSTQDLIACQVTEDNPNFNDTWGGPSGSQGSNAITQRTTYTLTCDDVVIDTATVNIIPIFIET